ncbi:OLC1v1008350C1 [Oldenlandia corymbosa var. corymbosa]|uniref:OLC1v1008350C1 n=1 Tax=Oldenlandia corymbosa var. corymbosa TaxID=529605 RepID=A0AAV1DLR8_OLDCO|nr:OLC1v1008350C1 [Oldenlandia corymbosa var. corymbosa]
MLDAGFIIIGHHQIYERVCQRPRHRRPRCGLRRCRWRGGRGYLMGLEESKKRGICEVIMEAKKITQDTKNSMQITFSKNLEVKVSGN